MLSCLFEMIQYKSPLCCLPYSAGALVAPTSDRYNLEAVRNKVMEDIKQEWEMALSMEMDQEASCLLHRLCPQVLWQSYRELACTVEQENFRCSDRLQALIMAWLPLINSSANVEDCFSAMADAVARSGKTDVGSMCNLQSVHIRACCQRMADGENQGRAVHLSSHDFEGNEIRGLRPRLFLPATFSGSAWTCFLFSSANLEPTLRKYYT